MFHPPAKVKLTISIYVVQFCLNVQGVSASKLSPPFQRALIFPRLRTSGNLRVGPVFVAYESSTHTLIVKFSRLPRENFESWEAR